jgi:hypothetical protein
MNILESGEFESFSEFGIYGAINYIAKYLPEYESMPVFREFAYSCALHVSALIDDDLRKFLLSDFTAGDLKDFAIKIEKTSTELATTFAAITVINYANVLMQPFYSAVDATKMTAGAAKKALLFANCDVYEIDNIFNKYIKLIN